MALPTQLGYVTPGPRDALWKLADYVELRTLLAMDKAYSETELQQDLNRAGDHEKQPDTGFDDESYEASVGNAFTEVAERSKNLEGSGFYPFKLDSDGVSLLRQAGDWPTDKYYLYSFLLLTTYLHMRKFHKFSHNGVEEDATAVFEHLSCEAVQAFMGCTGPTAGAFVFGTGAKVESDDDETENEKLFAKKINQMTTLVSDGGQFENVYKGKVTAKDDGLDIVAWKGFRDHRRSKIIVLGQCKTGHSWSDSDVSRLEPASLERKWLSGKFEYDPIRAFTCTKQVDPQDWPNAATKGVLVLDRCRLLHDHVFSADTIDKCRDYVEFVLNLPR